VTRSTHISEPAGAELSAAVRWYEGQQPGLGGKLFDAVMEAVSLIERHPEIGRSLSLKPHRRQLLVEGFPFHVVYQLTETMIAILAIAHVKRRPDYWKSRE